MSEVQASSTSADSAPVLPVASEAAPHPAEAQKTYKKFKYNPNISMGVDVGQHVAEAKLEAQNEAKAKEAAKEESKAILKPEAKLENKDAAQSKEEIKQAIAELGDADLDKLVSIKVNGEVKKVPLKEAIVRAQRAEAGQKALQERAELDQTLKAIQNLIENDPAELFRRAGKDPDAFAEERLQQRLAEMQMTPEQKEVEKIKREHAEMQKFIKEQNAAVEQQQMTAKEQQYAQQIDDELTAAFKSSGLPKTRLYVQQAAAIARGAALRGEDMSLAQAVEIVKERYPEEMRESLSVREAKEIDELLGPDIAKKLRAYYVQQLQSPPSEPPKRTAQTNVESRNKPARMITEREWRAKFR